MILLRDYKGLKFPDEYIVRFFFKESLHSHPGKVLELGCANGNNLQLFYQHGFAVTGVDLSEERVSQARHNFSALSGNGLDPAGFTFVHEDMLSYLERDENTYDVVLLPSSLYYLDESGIDRVLRKVRRNMKPGTRFFLRMRTPEDYRCGKGVQLSPRSWRLTIAETGERDCTVTCYRKEEFEVILSSLWKPVRTCWCKCRFDNPQNGVLVTNDDFIVWGEV